MIVSAMSQAWRDRPGDIAVSQYRSRVGEMPKFKGNVWLLFHFHFHHFYLSIPSLASHGIQYPTNFHAEKFNLESEGWSFGGNGGCVFTFIISLPLQTRRNKKKLSGGMALQGNSWSCSCENVWLGRWLRRWMREVER